MLIACLSFPSPLEYSTPPPFFDRKHDVAPKLTLFNFYWFFSVLIEHVMCLLPLHFSVILVCIVQAWSHVASVFMLVCVSANLHEILIHSV